MQNRRQILKAGLLGTMALLLFNFPFITIPNKIALLFSVPVLYLYVFGIWLMLIIAVLLVIDRRKSKKTKGNAHE